jgi:EGF domain
VLRTLARAWTSVLVLGCAFDSGGVSGPGSGLGEDGATTLEQTTGGGTAGGTVDASTTQASAEGSTGSGSSGSTTGAGDSVDSTAADPTDPCAVDNGGCDVDARCTPDPSGEVAVCDCNPGFEGNGVTCAVSPALMMLRADGYCGLSVGSTCGADDVHVEQMMVGEPGTVYVVTLRVRGVVELKSYDGGQPDGPWHPDGDPGDVDLWNEVTLSIAESAAVPGQTIRLNSGSSGATSLTLIDMTHDVLIETGAVVGLTFDVVDGLQINNGDDLVVPGIPPAPDAFNGQFVQIDALGFAAM